MGTFNKLYVMKKLLVFLILAAVITYDFYRYKLRCNVAVGVLFGAALLLSNFLFDSHARNDHQLQSFTVVRAWLIISLILLWELTSNRPSKSSSFVKVLEFNLKRFWKWLQYFDSTSCIYLQVYLFLRWLICGSFGCQKLASVPKSGMTKMLGWNNTKPYQF